MTDPMSVHEVGAAFMAGATDQAREWLASARRQIARDLGELEMLFAAAARACGRAPLTDGWGTHDAARVLVLASMPGRHLDQLRSLYDHGDADERRAVLLALDVIEVEPDGALAIVEDALRTNDTRLITAALGRYGARHLSQSAYRHAILKCVFCGIPLASVSGLDERADPELARMLHSFVRERSVAGRAVPEDVWPILARFPPGSPAPGAADAHLRPARPHDLADHRRL